MFTSSVLGLVLLCLISFVFLLMVGRHSTTSERQTIAVCYFDLRNMHLSTFEIINLRSGVLSGKGRSSVASRLSKTTGLYKISGHGEY
jgi:hypothetical protein